MARNPKVQQRGSLVNQPPNQNQAAGINRDGQHGDLQAMVSTLIQESSRLKRDIETLRDNCRDEIYRRIFVASFGSNAILRKDQEPGKEAEWIFEDINQRLASFLGRPVDDLRGMRVLDALGVEEDLLRVLALADQVVLTDQPEEITGTLKRFGWNFFARLTPLGNNQVAFTAMDISPRMRLEEETRVLRTLAENIPEGIAIADAQDGVIRMLSRYGREQAGLSDELLVNLPLEEIPQVWKVFDVTTHALIPLENLPIIRSLENGEVIENEEMVLEVTGGQRLTMSVHSVPIRDDGGNITGAVAAWRDITERKRQAVEREKLIDQLRLEKEKSAQLAAEAQARAEELEAIFNAIADAVVIFREGKPVQLNPAAARTYGVDVSGENLRDLMVKFHSRDIQGSPMDQERLPSARASRGENVRDEWMQYTDLQGKNHIIMSSASPLYRGGKVDGTVSVWRDMTEHEELLASLEDERSRLKTILNCAPDGIYVVDDKGAELFSNPAAVRLMRSPLAGETAAGETGMPVMCYPDGRDCPPDDLPISRSLRQGETVINQEMLYRWPDGGTRSVLVSTAPIQDGHGKTRGAVRVFQDISYLKHAEEALRSSQELYRLMGEALPYGVWYSDAEGKTSYVSPAFLELLGMSLEQVQNSEWLQRLVPGEREAISQEWARSLRTGEMIEHELHIEGEDGKITSVLSRGLPQRDGEGKITGWAGINLDVTDRNALAEQVNRREAQVELQHHLIYQRERERLKIAQELHDGPIQELYGVVYTLKSIENDLKGRQAQDDLHGVEASLQGLARDLRQFCNELRPPSLGAFGLESAIQVQADNLQARYPTLVINLSLDTEGLRLPPEVRLALFRACQELMTNAARHARATRVNISLRIEPDTVRMEIEDNGVGFSIPAGWNDLARNGHLGLASAQERVDAVGGTMNIESNPGAGTTVHITIGIPAEIQGP